MDWLEYTTTMDWLEYTTTMDWLEYTAITHDQAQVQLFLYFCCRKQTPVYEG